MGFVTTLLLLCYCFVTTLLPPCYPDVPRCYLGIAGCSWVLLGIARCCWVLLAVPRLLPGCYLVLLHRQRTPVPPELADMFDEIDIEKKYP